MTDVAGGRRTRDRLLLLGFSSFVLGEALLTPVPGSRPLALVLCLGMVAAIAQRRRAPLPALVGVTAINLLGKLVGAAPEGSYVYSVALPLLFFGVAAYSPSRRAPSMVAAGLVLAAYTVVSQLARGPAPFEWLLGGTLYAAGLAAAGAALGLQLRDRSADASRLRLRVGELERAIGGRETRAAEAEQRRVASQVRVLITHFVERVRRSLSDADGILLSDPERAATLLERTGDSARSALTSMRATLDRLRAEDDDGPGEVRRRTLVRDIGVDDLVDELASSGVRVEVTGADGAQVPAVVVGAAARVAGESAELIGGSARRALIRLDGQRLRVELRGRGRKPRAAVRAPGVVAAVERIRLLGGTFAARPWAGRVTVELPFEAAAPSRGEHASPRRAWACAAGRHLAPAALAALGIVEQSLQSFPEPLWQRLAVAIALPLPLLLRGRWPLIAIAGVQALLVAGTLHGALGDAAAEGPLVALVTAFAAGASRASRAAGALAAALAVVVPQVAMSLEQTPWPVRSYVGFVAMLAASWLVGRLVREQLAVAAGARTEIAELVDRGRAAERLAAARERARLAREIHDVVGHAVLVVCVQAGAAGSLAARDPGAARQAIRSALGASDAAAGELGRLPVLLPGIDTTGAPGIADLPALVEGVRRTGLDAELRLAVAAEVDPGVGTAVYRVVQEALTNAGKHAPDAAVTVELEVEPGGVDLVVANAAPVGTDAGGGGHGVHNMRERAVEHGGALSVGHDGGDWVVRASFPGLETVLRELDSV